MDFHTAVVSNSIASIHKLDSAVPEIIPLTFLAEICCVFKINFRCILFQLQHKIWLHHGGPLFDTVFKKGPYFGQDLDIIPPNRIYLIISKIKQ